MTFVFNASPLIVLAKSALLETMLELPENALIDSCESLSRILSCINPPKYPILSLPRGSERANLQSSH